MRCRYLLDGRWGLDAPEFGGWAHLVHCTLHAATDSPEGREQGSNSCTCLPRSIIPKDLCIGPAQARASSRRQELRRPFGSAGGYYTLSSPDTLSVCSSERVTPRQRLSNLLFPSHVNADQTSSQGFCEFRRRARQLWRLRCHSLEPWVLRQTHDY